MVSEIIKEGLVHKGGRIHILQSNNMSDVGKVLEATSLIVIMTTAFISNITAVTIILRVPSLRRNPHNLLILNLSIADLGVVLTSMTFSTVSVFDRGKFLTEHATSCTIHGFWANIFSVINVMTIAGIAIDRVLIVTSLKTLVKGLRRVYLIIALAWFVGIVISLPPALRSVSAIVYIPRIRHCSIQLENTHFGFLSCIILYFFAIPTLIASYTTIGYFLWKQSNKLDKIKAKQQIYDRCKTDTDDISKTPSMAEMDFTTRCEKEISFTEDESKDIRPDNELSSKDVSFVKDGSKKDIENNGKKDSYEHKAQGISISPGGEDTDTPTNRIRFSEENGNTSKKDDEQSQHEDYDKKRVRYIQTVRIRQKVKRKEKHFRAQKQVSILGALLVFSMAVCWSPYILIRTIDVQVAEAVGVFSMWLAYCVTIFDPLIYAFMNRRARKELKTYMEIIKLRLRCSCR